MFAVRWVLRQAILNRQAPCLDGVKTPVEDSIQIAQMFRHESGSKPQVFTEPGQSPVLYRAGGPFALADDLRHFPV
jgi:hypothetical protein